MSDPLSDLLMMASDPDPPSDDCRCCICGSERPPGYRLLCRSCAQDSEVRAAVFGGIAERLKAARLALEATYTAKL